MDPVRPINVSTPPAQRSLARGSMGSSSTVWRAAPALCGLTRRAVLALPLATAACRRSAQPFAGYAFIANQEGGALAVVDLGVMEVAKHIPIEGSPTEILAWVGPHICSRHYEVGSEVLNRCKEVYGAKAHTAFIATRPDHWQADLGKLAEMALSGCGITAMYSSGHCTFARTDLLYSYRRNREGGRFASLIWITPD